MESTVAALLLVVSAVAISCVVVTYAVNVAEQSLNTQNNPQIDQIRSLESDLLNQTNNMLNQTQAGIPNQPSP
jgi:hypothetical protein